MQVEELLLQTLEKLLHEDFHTFQWYLSIEVLDGCKPFAKSHLEKASRTETINKMIGSYGKESAVRISTVILRKMNLNSEAEKLQDDYSEGKTAAPSTSSPSSTSSPAATPAPASMSAQQGSVIFAPMVTGSTSGSWNININK